MAELVLIGEMVGSVVVSTVRTGEGETEGGKDRELDSSRVTLEGECQMRGYLVQKGMTVTEMLGSKVRSTMEDKARTGTKKEEMAGGEDMEREARKGIMEEGLENTNGLVILVKTQVKGQGVELGQIEAEELTQQ